MFGVNQDMRICGFAGNAEVAVVQDAPLSIHLENRNAAILLGAFNNKIASSQKGAYNVGGNYSPTIPKVLIIEIPDGKGEPKVVWTAPEFDTHHGGNILLNGRLYGSTWINNEKGNWACYDWQSGAEIYNEPWPKHSKGSIISADSMLYIYDELRGEIALVNPASDKLDIVSTMRVKMGKGKHWCHPVICDGVMYVRRGNVLMAYDLKK